MDNQKRFEQEQRSPAEIAADAAREAHKNLRETAEEQVGEGRTDAESRRLLNFLREQPLMCAGAAFAAGFVVGGGLGGDLGLALAGILARTAFRNAMDNFMGGDRSRRGAVDPT